MHAERVNNVRECNSNIVQVCQDIPPSPIYAVFYQEYLSSVSITYIYHKLTLTHYTLADDTKDNFNT